MKKRAIFLAVCLVFMSISLAQALPIYTISDTGGRTTNGGPFLITGNSMNFETFCVETKEYISLPHNYYGSIDDIVVFSSGGNKNSFSTLSDNTKRLYSYFLDHPLLTHAEEGQIQVAIWTYQNQPDYTTPPAPGVNLFYDNASTFAITHTIKVLNLWDADVGNGPYIGSQYAYDHKAQSQLFPVPEPSILMLLGLGLIGLAGIRRKL